MNSYNTNPQQPTHQTQTSELQMKQRLKTLALDKLKPEETQRTSRDSGCPFQLPEKVLNEEEKKYELSLKRKSSAKEQDSLISKQSTPKSMSQCLYENKQEIERNDNCDGLCQAELECKQESQKSMFCSKDLQKSTTDLVQVVRKCSLEDYASQKHKHSECTTDKSQSSIKEQSVCHNNSEANKFFLQSLNMSMKTSLVRKKLVSGKNKVASVQQQNNQNYYQEFIPNQIYRNNQLYQSSSRVYNGQFSSSGKYYYGSVQFDDHNEIFVYRTKHSCIEETLDPEQQLLRIQAKDSIWTISDIIVAPQSESFLLYSTLSGVIKMIDLKKVEQNLLDNPNLKMPITKVQDKEVRLLCENRQQEESQEPPCILLKKKIVYSMSMNPAQENELWAGLKFGKLLLYDLEKQEMIAQNNRAHVMGYPNHNTPISFSDTFDVNSVKPTNNENVIASAADDGIIKIWDKRMFSAESLPVGGFIGHHQGLVSLDYCRNKPLICSSSKDQSIKLWDLRKMNTTDEILDHKIKKSSYDYRLSTSYRYKHHKFSNDYSLQSFSGGHQAFRTLIRCRFSPDYTDQRYIYTGSFYGGAVIYDTRTSEVKENLLAYPDLSCSHLSRDVYWHPKEPILFATSFSGSISIFNYNSYTNKDYYQKNVLKSKNPITSFK